MGYTAYELMGIAFLFSLGAPFYLLVSSSINDHYENMFDEYGGIEFRPESRHGIRIVIATADQTLGLVDVGDKTFDFERIKAEFLGIICLFHGGAPKSMLPDWFDRFRYSHLIQRDLPEIKAWYRSCYCYRRPGFGVCRYG